jgi:hypothetical protein
MMEVHHRAVWPDDRAGRCDECACDPTGPSIGATRPVAGADRRGTDAQHSGLRHGRRRRPTTADDTATDDITDAGGIEFRDGSGPRVDAPDRAMAMTVDAVETHGDDILVRVRVENATTAISTWGSRTRSTARCW